MIHLRAITLALPILTGAIAVLPDAATAGEACGGGRIAVGGTCTETAQVAAEIRDLVGRTIERDDLNAVILSVSVGDTPVLTEAWGESLAGVAATPDMHFRNGPIPIPSSTPLLLQLHPRQAPTLGDPP